MLLLSKDRIDSLPFTSARQARARHRDFSYMTLVEADTDANAVPNADLYIADDLIATNSFGDTAADCGECRRNTTQFSGRDNRKEWSGDDLSGVTAFDRRHAVSWDASGDARFEISAAVNQKDTQRIERRAHGLRWRARRHISEAVEKARHGWTQLVVAVLQHKKDGSRRKRAATGTLFEPRANLHRYSFYLVDPKAPFDSIAKTTTDMENSATASVIAGPAPARAGDAASQTAPKEIAGINRNLGSEPSLQSLHMSVSTNSQLVQSALATLKQLADSIQGQSQLLSKLHFRQEENTRNLNMLTGKTESVEAQLVSLNKLLMHRQQQQKPSAPSASRTPTNGQAPTATTAFAASSLFATTPSAELQPSAVYTNASMQGFGFASGYPHMMIPAHPSTVMPTASSITCSVVPAQGSASFSSPMASPPATTIIAQRSPTPNHHQQQIQQQQLQQQQIQQQQLQQQRQLQQYQMQEIRNIYAESPYLRDFTPEEQQRLLMSIFQLKHLSEAQNKKAQPHAQKQNPHQQPHSSLYMQNSQLQQQMQQQHQLQRAQQLQYQQAQAQELNKAEEQKRQLELERANELKKMEEIKRQAEELRRAEALKQAEKLRQAEALKKAEELKRQQEIQLAQERREEMLRQLKRKEEHERLRQQLLQKQQEVRLHQEQLDQQKRQLEMQVRSMEAAATSIDPSQQLSSITSDPQAIAIAAAPAMHMATIPSGASRGPSTGIQVKKESDVNSLDDPAVKAGNIAVVNPVPIIPSAATSETIVCEGRLGPVDMGVDVKPFIPSLEKGDAKPNGAANSAAQKPTHAMQSNTAAPAPSTTPAVANPSANPNASSSADASLNGIAKENRALASNPSETTTAPPKITSSRPLKAAPTRAHFAKDSSLRYNADKYHHSNGHQRYNGDSDSLPGELAIKGTNKHARDEDDGYSSPRRNTKPRMTSPCNLLNVVMFSDDSCDTDDDDGSESTLRSNANKLGLGIVGASSGVRKRSVAVASGGAADITTRLGSRLHGNDAGGSNLNDRLSWPRNEYDSDSRFTDEGPRRINGRIRRVRTRFGILPTDSVTGDVVDSAGEPINEERVSELMGPSFLIALPSFVQVYQMFYGHPALADGISQKSLNHHLTSLSGFKFYGCHIAANSKSSYSSMFVGFVARCGDDFNNMQRRVRGRLFRSKVVLGPLLFSLVLTISCTRIQNLTPDFVNSLLKNVFGLIIEDLTIVTNNGIKRMSSYEVVNMSISWAKDLCEYISEGKRAQDSLDMADKCQDAYVAECRSRGVGGDKTTPMDIDGKVALAMLKGNVANSQRFLGLRSSDLKQLYRYLYHTIGTAVSPPAMRYLKQVSESFIQIRK
ncbi:hypothetical protein GGI07_001594 [Coemansia sp. Benny D115]|nr:hypothetical protein GGI07_001594 [Coemansia sp. Benny D115]